MGIDRSMVAKQVVLMLQNIRDVRGMMGPVLLVAPWIIKASSTFWVIFYLCAFIVPRILLSFFPEELCNDVAETRQIKKTSSKGAEKNKERGAEKNKERGAE